MGLWFNRLTGRPYANVGGAPMFATRAQLEACCCPAPCACPCDPWPPEEWPCAGLTEQYAVGFDFTRDWFYSVDDCSGDPDRSMSGHIDITVTATPGSCGWTGFVMHDFGDPLGTIAVYVDINLVGTPPCYWEYTVTIFMEACAGRKTAGGTPPGSYESCSQCWGGGGFSSRATVTGFVVS